MSNSKELQRKIERLKKEIERLCKARAEAKFTWIMPSRSQRCIYMNERFTTDCLARSVRTRAIELARIAECSRHYEKGNLLYEGQRPVALRVCVTRSGRLRSSSDMVN